MENEFSNLDHLWLSILKRYLVFILSPIIPEIKLQLGFAKLFLLYIEMHIWNRSSDLKWNYIQGTISFARFSFFTHSHRLMHLVSKGYSWKCISFLDQWFWSNDSVGKIYSGFLMVPWIKREIVLKVFHSFKYISLVLGILNYTILQQKGRKYHVEFD